MFLPCLFPSLSSPNLIILRVSEYITLLKILLIYYIKFFNFGVAFSGLLSLIKILNINFNYFTMDKNIKDYITGMYNFLYDLHIDDPGTCMTGTVYHMMVTGGINMIQTRECRYCVN
jgi:hypothetical protein